MRRIAPVGEAFVDREDDQRAVLSFCENRSATARRYLLLRCRPGTGITSLLHHVKFSMAMQALVVYADVRNATKQDIIAQYFVERSKKRIDLLLAWLDWRQFASTLLKVGGAIVPPIRSLQTATVAGTEIIQPLLFTPFESQPLEQLSRAVRFPIHKQHVLFLLDNAQADFAAIEGLLRTTHAEEYEHVKFVIVYASEQDRQDEYLVFRERVVTCGVTLDEWQFTGITREFVTAIGRVRNIALGEREVEDLIRRSTSNVWHLLRLLREGRAREPSFSPVEKHVLRLLILAEQSLRRSDVRTLTTTSPLVHVSGEAEWLNAVQHLESLHLIAVAEAGASDANITITSTAHPDVADLASDHAGNLPVIQELYDYFDRAERARTPRHSSTYTAPLLYRLSRKIDPLRVPSRAQKLVEAALAQGSLADAERYIDDACRGGAVSLHDYFLQISFYVACQDFEKAWKIIQALDIYTVDRYPIFRLLRAVVLNRIRKHEASLQEIDRLMAVPRTSPHEMAVLASYKVSGLLHEGREAEAADFAQQIAPALNGAKGYAYFLRNAASAFMWGEPANKITAETMLKEAGAAMHAARDDFGEQTVLNNQGVLACYLGDFAKGLELFEESYRALRVYGTHHLEEVGVNVGSALLRVGRWAEAAQHLLRYCAITEWDFPRCLGENALVLAEWVTGAPDRALQRMAATVERAQHLALADARFRTLYNSIVLEGVAHGPTGDFRTQLTKLRETCWASEEELAKLSQTVTGGARSPETMCELWSLDYCQYWSQNPLAMLPQELLTL